MMRKHTLAGLGMVWSQAMCAKVSNGHGHLPDFASAPPRQPSGSSGLADFGAGAALGGGGEAGVGPRDRGHRSSPQQGVGGHGSGGAGGERSDKAAARSQLIFVGTGSSTAVPSAFVLLHPELDSRQSAIAQLSVATPPEVNKNYRGNTSVLVRVVKEEKQEGADSGGEGEDGNGDRGGDGGERGRIRKRVQHVQIDTGKTWREGVIRWFPRHGVPGLDGIVLTHDHADAILGLDDVRSIQNSGDRTPTPVHVSQQTNKSVRRVFPYLVGREHDNGKGGRFVAALKFHVFQDFQPFEVGGLEVTPFPVLHGEDYVSHGFLFGPEGNKICYISDVSRVPPESLEFLQSQGPMQLLVCDALYRSRKHPTHFSVEDSVVLAGQLKARRTLLVGLGGDIEYHATNALLASQEEAEAGMPHVRLAYDGLAVDIDLRERKGQDYIWGDVQRPGEGVTQLDDGVKGETRRNGIADINVNDAVCCPVIASHLALQLASAGKSAADKRSKAQASTTISPDQPPTSPRAARRSSTGRSSPRSLVARRSDGRLLYPRGSNMRTLNPRRRPVA